MNNSINNPNTMGSGDTTQAKSNASSILDRIRQKTSGQIADTLNAESDKSNRYSTYGNSTNRGIQGQIDLLEDMVKFLSAFKEDLSEMQVVYERFLENLDEAGLDEKEHQKFVFSYIDTQKIIKTLEQDIEDDDISYAKKMIAYLNERPA